MSIIRGRRINHGRSAKRRIGSYEEEWEIDLYDPMSDALIIRGGEWRKYIVKSE